MRRQRELNPQIDAAVVKVVDGLIMGHPLLRDWVETSTLYARRRTKDTNRPRCGMTGKMYVLGS